MKTTLTLTLGLLAALASAQAIPAEIAPFAWSRGTLDLIASGDAARGAEIAQKEKCQKCHGDAGIAEDDESTNIAGQVAAYSFKQLVDYRTEVRESRDMKKAVRNLSLQEMADLSAHYAAQPPEAPAGGVEPPTMVTEGDEGRLLIGCNTCHGKNGQGLGFEVPALAGQKGGHFNETMNAFRDGDRANDQFGRMRFIASQLSDEEITTIAGFYAAPPTEEAE
jgi:cytochrome c553